MYANSARFFKQPGPVVDNREPLLVTSCGNYRMKSRPLFETKRPKGRPDYQLLYVASGKATFYFDGQPNLLHAGTAVLYRPGERQHYRYRAEDHTHVYWMHFTGSDVEQALKQHGLWDKQSFYVGGADLFPALFENIIRELQVARPLCRQLLSNYLAQIFLLLHRQLLENPTPSRTVEREIWDAINHFQKHYDQPIVVADYAQAHNMSSAWFIHEFKRRTGMPPMRYILLLRLNNAQALLTETNYPVSEIATIVGFSDPLYFSRLFKRHFGISPTQARQG